jgi:hypothetical protein
VQGVVQQDQVPGEFHVDITQEEAPGRYNGVFVTVPGGIIELFGDNDTLPELPDSLRRKDDVDIKPVEIEQESAGDDEMSKFSNPQAQTGMDDKVNKKITDKNIKLDNAEGAVSYTAGYIG